MTLSNERLQEMIVDFQAIENNFKINEKKVHINELEAKSVDPDFWNDQENAKRLMQELGDLKDEIEEYLKLKDEIETLKSLDSDKDSEMLTSEIDNAYKKLEEFKIKSYLSGIYDNKNALVSIHAGQGGTEAMDWANILYRMYIRFSEKRKWKTETIQISEGEEAGIKSITFKVEGNHAYGYLKNEAGAHRLVRQSPFNADNLRQTSFALVEVLPELNEVDYPDIKFNGEDLEWQFYRSGGHGGQNVNKVSTAVRLKHLPTGIVVTAQTERYQEQNRFYALNLLRAKLWALEQEKMSQNVKEIKGEYRPASWGNQIRSYILHPYKMVKDLRTGYEVSDPESVLDGELEGFIEAEIQI